MEFFSVQPGVIIFLVISRTIPVSTVQPSGCVVTEVLGHRSEICYKGFGKTQYQPACFNGGRLVINSVLLVTKPSCHVDRCCQPSSRDTRYNVSCLAATTSDMQLATMESGILRNCSGRENCTIEPSDRIEVPSIGQSAYLLLSYSCENYTLTDTVNICSSQTLTTTQGYLQFLSDDRLPPDKPTGCTCTVEGPDSRDLTVEALAVVLRDSGTLLNLHGFKNHAVFWNTALYGTNRTIFKDSNFSVTWQSTGRATTTLLWLNVSGERAFTVTCHGQSVKGEDQAWKKTSEVKPTEQTDQKKGTQHHETAIPFIVLPAFAAVLTGLLELYVSKCRKKKGNTDGSLTPLKQKP